MPQIILFNLCLVAVSVLTTYCIPRCDEIEEPLFFGKRLGGPFVQFDFANKQTLDTDFPWFVANRPVMFAHAEMFAKNKLFIRLETHEHNKILILHDYALNGAHGDKTKLIDGDFLPNLFETVFFENNDNIYGCHEHRCYKLNYATWEFEPFSKYTLDPGRKYAATVKVNHSTCILGGADKEAPAICFDENDDVIHAKWLPELNRKRFGAFFVNSTLYFCGPTNACTWINTKSDRDKSNDESGDKKLEDAFGSPAVMFERDGHIYTGGINFSEHAAFLQRLPNEHGAKLGPERQFLSGPGVSFDDYFSVITPCDPRYIGSYSAATLPSACMITILLAYLSV